MSILIYRHNFNLKGPSPTKSLRPGESTYFVGKVHDDVPSHESGKVTC